MRVKVKKGCRNNPWNGMVEKAPELSDDYISAAHFPEREKTRGRIPLLLCHLMNNHQLTVKSVAEEV